MHLFLWLINIVLYMYIYHSFFIHLPVNGYRGRFHVLAIINSVSVNIGVNVSFSILVSSGYIPSCGIAGSYSSFIPNFLRNLRIVFHSGYTNVHTHCNARSFLFLHTLQHLLFGDFLMIAIVTEVM